MATNRLVSSLIVLGFLIVSLSGCFADDPAPASTSGSDPAASSTLTGPLQPSDNGTQPTAAPPEPPLANFTVSVKNSTDANLTAGKDLLFNASASSDPAGGNLSYAWDFGDNATGEGVETNHTFAAPGNVTVTLTVTSDASGLSASANQTLAIIAGKPAVLTMADPSGDAKANYLDLRSAKVTDDGEFLIVTITLGAMCPCNAADTVFLTRVKVGTIDFEVYNYGGSSTYKLWDTTNGASVPGSAVRIAGTGWEIKIPLEFLAGKKIVAPYVMFTSTYVGEGFAGGVEMDDRMPNTGTVAYG